MLCYELNLTNIFGFVINRLTNKEFRIRFQMSQTLKKKIGDFQLGKTIGCGTFGKVKEGLHLPTGQKVAVKILEKNKIDNRQDLQRVQQELKILQKVEHPNIIRLLQLHETPSNLYIITELVEGIELYQMIVEQKQQKLTMTNCASYFCQLLNAVEFLHAKSICHRDIKPENIIIDRKTNILKLIDFGLSKQFHESGGLLQTSCGSPCYAAPQMLYNKKYDACRVDIWAMGVTLHAMIAGRLPYEEEDTQRLYNIIQRSPGYRCQKDIPQNVRKIIESMMQRDPKRRSSISDIRQTQWVKSQQMSVPQYCYENDSLLLESMSSFFDLTILNIKKILKNKEIPSICTYYFLGRRLKQSSSSTEHAKKLKAKIRSDPRFKDEDNCLSKNLMKFHNTDKENTNKNQSNQSETPSLPKQEKNQEYAIHDGPFHLNFAFQSLQELSTYICQMESSQNVKMLSNRLIEVKGVEVEIKQIQGTELLYADFPAYFNGAA